MARRALSRRRGRTRPGRLRLLDDFLVQSGWIRPPDQSNEMHVVDVGIGDSLDTTREMQQSVQQRFPNWKVTLTAIENDPGRAERLRKQASSAELSVLMGSFADAATLTPPPRLIRIMNVLRGYRSAEVAPAQRSLLEALAPGGLLVEGSSDTEGHSLSAHLWRRLPSDPTESMCAGTLAFSYEGLLFATDCARGFAPRMFRDVLPRDLRRSVRPGEPVADWLAAWQRIVEQVRVTLPRGVDDRVVFEASLGRLAAAKRSTRADWAPLGCALWTPLNPSERKEVLGTSEG